MEGKRVLRVLLENPDEVRFRRLPRIICDILIRSWVSEHLIDRDNHVHNYSEFTIVVFMSF